MASIEKRGKKWCVRWREDGRERKRTCPTKTAARELRAQIERNIALGIPGLTKRATPLQVQEAVELYLDWSIVSGASLHSIDSRRTTLIRFATWWLALHPRDTMIDLEIALLDRYSAHLAGRIGDRLDRPIKARSRQLYLTLISTWWKWTADRYPARCAAWRKVDMPRSMPTPQPAPTWAEMDAFIRIARPASVQSLAIMLRYTGMRVTQAQNILWSDIDMDRALLTVRPENDKTRRGRVIPLHPELHDHLRSIQGIAGHVLRVTHATRSLYRLSTQFWRESGAREGIKGWHSFRRGFETGLAAAGVDIIRIKKLAGHSLGVDDSYLDAAGLDLAEAIGRIPSIDWAEKKAEVIPLVSTECPQKNK